MSTFLQHQMDWDLLRIFYSLCQFSTLTEAAKHLNTTQSNLSRRLADLEFNLGYRVFNRGQGGLALLEEGRELLELVAPVFHKFTQYQARRDQENQRAQGVLKVSIASHLPVSWLMQKTSQFLEDHSQLSFSLIQQYSPSGHFKKYADCAIQFFDDALKDDLIQQPLCYLCYGLYVSQDYLTKKNSLETIEDVQSHPKLILKVPGSETPLGWPESVVYDPKPSRIHEFSTAQDLLEATQQGLGVAALPRSQAALHPNLIALPFSIKDQVIKLYYAYPKYYQDLKRITLYGNFLEQRFKNDIGTISQDFVTVHDLVLDTG